MSQSPEELLQILESPAPNFSQPRALEVLKKHYGIEGKLTCLASERDQNFLVTTPEDEKCLLKFANNTEDPEVTNFQTLAFLHVEKADPDMVVSRALPSLNGEMEFTATGEDGKISIVRLFSWVEGIAMSSVAEENRPDNAEELGGMLARMATALEDFTHPAMKKGLLYDVRLVDILEPLLKYVDDASLKDFVTAQMEIFKRDIKPALESMPFQVIFNDCSPRNYIVNPENPAEFRGFIDFGDMVHTPRIVDIAVACVYLVDESSQPMAKVQKFLQGYHRLKPLNTKELAVLQDVMLCRTMILVLIYHWRAGMFPENKEYIMQNLPQAKKTIESIASLDRQDTLQKFEQACHQTVTV